MSQHNQHMDPSLLSSVANNPPQIQGGEIFRVNVGFESIYTFTVTDDSDSDITVGIVGDMLDGSVLERSGTTYTFKWTLAAPTNASSLVFYANDSLNAVSVLNPRVEMCACQNNGNCTLDGVEPAVNNIVIMTCNCPGGMFMFWND